MKMLITGVAGFLGSHLADRMIEFGHQVVGVDNLAGGELANVNEQVDFHQVDCADLQSMNQLTRGCEVVFHAACSAHDGFSVVSPNWITQQTFQITMSVLSAALNQNVRRFVFCSSMSRYGEQPVIPFTEDMVCKPRVPYGIAKYAAEQVVSQLCEVNGAEYVIIVPHNIIGPRQKYSDPYRNVAGIMINRMLQNKQPIIYGDGNQKRCFSFIDDVIYCLEKAILLDNVNREIINIGPDEEFVTVNTLARTIAEELEIPFDPLYVNERPLEVKYATCSADKARRLLHYETQVSFRQGIQSMVRFVKERGPREFTYHLPIEIRNRLTPNTWTDKLI